MPGPLFLFDNPLLWPAKEKKLTIIPKTLQQIVRFYVFTCVINDNLLSAPGVEAGALLLLSTFPGDGVDNTL